MSFCTSTLTGSAPPGLSRTAFGGIILLASFYLLIALSFTLFTREAAAAGFCATPGKDGVAGSLSGVINTYYPVTASVTAGATSITLGTSRGAATGITAGDMLLVVQMQDADINYSDSSAYGSGGTSGAGHTAINQAGVYEYVKATNTVGTGGGTVNLATGLVYSYRYRTASTTNGASSFQIIRVPQYSTATVAAGGVTAAPWNGATGAIVAVDVAGALTMNGNIDVSGLGFRGGWGENANVGGLNTNYRTRANVTGNGMKGEGIAGSPNRMNMPASYAAAPTQSTVGNLGYPNGTNTDASKARGAPGNAGGGGSDGAANNGDNSGGGGGGNYGGGGKGGNTWNSNYASGGEGGGSVPVAFNRIFLGGGGGSGATNNGGGDNNTYPNNNAKACSLTGGNCSSGSPGGGIVIVRAKSISGGSILAKGSHGFNVMQDGAGGGGAGGTVILETYSGGTTSVDVSGGDGGNSWRSQDPGGYPGERHGPGGGGSGGFIAYAPSSGFTIGATYAGGLNGATTTAVDTYGSSGSIGGTYTYQVPNVPGSNTGYDCSPKLTKAYSATDIGIGTSSTLTFTITNGVNDQAQSGLAFTDTFPAGLTVTAVTALSGTGCSGSTSNTASTVVLSAGAITAGNTTCTFTATISGNTAGSYVNDSARFSGLGGGLNTDATTATLNVRRAALTKSYNSANISESGSSILTFTLTNGSGNPAQTNLTFTDTLTTGAGLTITGVTALTGSGCSATMPTFNATSDPSVTLSSATMAQAATVCSFTATVQGNTAGTYDNLAANISGASAAVDPSGVSATLNVIGAPPPSSGNKPLYLYDSSSSPGYKLSRTPMTVTAGAYVTIPRGNNTRSWTLNPALAADVTISSGTFQASLWLASNASRTFSIPVVLRCGATTVASLTQSKNLTTTVTQFTFALPLAADYTCTAPNTWALDITNTQGTGGTARDIRVYPAPSAGNYSKVTLASQTVINVNSIALYDGAYPGGSTIAAAITGSTVYIRSVVSDPFGSYDINANPPATRPTITITDKDGSTVVPATAMTELGALTTAGTKTFEYSYTVPGSPVGNWLLRVDAVEGTEGNVSHYRQAIMPVFVPQPLISILKSANRSNASPGEVIIYNVQIVNTGTGIGANVVLTDDLSPYGSFYLGAGAPFTPTDSSPASGLSLSAPQYSNNNGTTWLYAPVSGGGGAPAGYDGNVTNWRIPMTGTIRAGGSFILNYQVIVK